MVEKARGGDMLGPQCGDIALSFMELTFEVLNQLLRTVAAELNSRSLLTDPVCKRGPMSAETGYTENDVELLALRTTECVYGA